MRTVAVKFGENVSLSSYAECIADFVEVIVKGENKIASVALLPHQIVNDFIEGDVYDEKEMEDMAELQWKSYVNHLEKVSCFERALAVCDTSGSMEGEPLAVAISLSLLITGVSKPPFHR